VRLVPDSATSLILGALTFKCLELIVDRIEDERPILDIMNVMKKGGASFAFPAIDLYRNRAAEDEASRSRAAPRPPARKAGRRGQRTIAREARLPYRVVIAATVT